MRRLSTALTAASIALAAVSCGPGTSGKGLACPSVRQSVTSQSVASAGGQAARDGACAAQ